jgi:NAD(P)H-dependent flavin oxidoreductase YrpB (nitropropane dioxygenase family)
MTFINRDRAMSWNTPLLTQALDLLYRFLTPPMAEVVSTPALTAIVSNDGTLAYASAKHAQTATLNIAIEQPKKATSKSLTITFFIAAHTHSTTSKMQTTYLIFQTFAAALDIELFIPQPPFTVSLEDNLTVFFDHRLHILSVTLGSFNASWITIVKGCPVSLIDALTNLKEAQ